VAGGALERALSGALSAGPRLRAPISCMRLPLLRRENHDVFRSEDIILQRAARNHMISRLNFHHGYAVAAFAEGCLFVEFDGLCYVIWTQDRKLRRIHGFYFSCDVVLAQFA